MSKHARLSASSAERWIQCPASVQLSAGVPNKSSIYAQYGTVLHDIAAWCLETQTQVHEILSHDEDREPVQFYLGWLSKHTRKGDEVRVEVALDKLRSIDPDLGGTADYIRWRPSTKELLVADLKTGSGVDVDAENNTQLMIYALGAMLEMGVAARIVKVAIVQPRIADTERHVKVWEFDGFALLDFAGELKIAAEATRDPTPRYGPGEKVCRWCPAGEAGLCDQRVKVARRRVATVSAAADFDVLT